MVEAKIRGAQENPAITQNYETIILKPHIVDGVNIISQQDISGNNKKFVIKWGFTLVENLVLGTGCIIDFDGGFFTSGEEHYYSITGNDTRIILNQDEASCLKNVYKDGTWLYPEFPLSPDEFQREDDVIVIGDEAVGSRNLEDESVEETKIAPESVTRKHLSRDPENSIADNDDLIVLPTGQLQLANKAYVPENFSGLGRVYLRKNIVQRPNVASGSWLTYVAEGKTYLLYWYNNVLYNCHKIDNYGLVVVNHIAVETAEYDVEVLPDYAQENSLHYTESGGLITITLPDGTTVTASSIYDVTLYPYWDSVDDINMLTQDMMQQAAAIYIIQYDYKLGEDITIPAGCVLKFEGGSISGSHTITGNNTGIEAGLVKIFNTNIIIAGSWEVAFAYPVWFGAVGDGIANDSKAITNLFKFKTPFFDSEKIYNVFGATFEVQDISIYLNGAVIKELQNITAKGKTMDIDLGGGIIESTCHFAKIAEVFSGGSTIVVDDSSNLQVGQKIASSYGDHLSDWPFDVENLKVASISGNTVTLNKSITTSLEVPIGVYIGDFEWSSMIGYTPNVTKNIVIKNGEVCKTPGYFVSAGVHGYSYPNSEENECTFLFENVDFNQNGYDAFIFFFTTAIFNGCKIRNTLDIAKQGINYGPGAKVYLYNTTMDRCNYDIDIVDATASGWGIDFSHNERLGRVYVDSCKFIARNLLSGGSEHFKEPSLHAINLCVTEDNTIYFNSLVVKNTSFEGYSRHAIGTTVIPKRTDTFINDVLIDNCSFNGRAVVFMEASEEHVYSIKNFSLHDSYVHNETENVEVVRNVKNVEGCTFELSYGNILHGGNFANCLIKGIGNSPVSIYAGDFHAINVELLNCTLESDSSYYGTSIDGSFVSEEINRMPEEIVRPSAANAYGLAAPPSLIFKYKGSIVEYNVLMIAYDFISVATIRCNTVAILEDRFAKSLKPVDFPKSVFILHDVYRRKIYTASGYPTTVVEKETNNSIACVNKQNTYGINIHKSAYAFVKGTNCVYIRRVERTTWSDGKWYLQLDTSIEESLPEGTEVFLFYLEDTRGFICNPLINTPSNRPNLRENGDVGYCIIERDKPIYWTGSKWVDATGAQV